MGSDMVLRDVYLPAGAAPNLAAATAVAAQLCDNATIEDLSQLLFEEWIVDENLDDESVDAITSRADVLRATAKTWLLDWLDRFVMSLTWRDVARFRVDDESTEEGLDGYVTGGVSSGDGPTDAYDVWDLVYDDYRFPAGWSESARHRVRAAAPARHRTSRRDLHVPYLGLTGQRSRQRRPDSADTRQRIPHGLAAAVCRAATWRVK